MPERTEPIPQPSFTNSTYRAIAANSEFGLNIDQPLANQPDIQAFLHAPNQGPVPENLLYRLLILIESVLNEKVDKKLEGLCLGYTIFPLEDSSLSKTNSSPTTFYVSWGWHPLYVSLIGSSSIYSQSEEEADEPEKVKDDLTLLKGEDIDSIFIALNDFVQEELKNSVSDSSLFLENRLCSFLIGHFEPEINDQITMPTAEGEVLDGSISFDLDVFPNSPREELFSDPFEILNLHGRAGCGSCTRPGGKPGRKGRGGACDPC